MDIEDYYSTTLFFTDDQIMIVNDENDGDFIIIKIKSSSFILSCAAAHVRHLTRDELLVSVM